MPSTSSFGLLGLLNDRIESKVDIGLSDLRLYNAAMKRRHAALADILRSLGVVAFWLLGTFGLAVPLSLGDCPSQDGCGDTLRWIAIAILLVGAGGTLPVFIVSLRYLTRQRRKGPQWVES